METSNTSGVESLSEYATPTQPYFWTSLYGTLTLAAIVCFSVALFTVVYIYIRIRRRSYAQDKDPESAETLAQHSSLENEVRGWKSLGSSGFFSDSKIWNHLIPLIRTDLEDEECRIDKEFLKSMHSCRTVNQLESVLSKYPDQRPYFNWLVGYAYRNANSHR